MLKIWDKSWTSLLQHKNKLLWINSYVTQFSELWTNPDAPHWIWNASDFSFLALVYKVRWPFSCHLKSSSALHDFFLSCKILVYLGCLTVNGFLIYLTVKCCFCSSKCDPSAQNQSQVAYFYFLSMMHHLKEKHILFTMTQKLSFYLNPNRNY